MFTSADRGNDLCVTLDYLTTCVRAAIDEVIVTAYNDRPAYALPAWQQRAQCERLMN